MHSLRCLALALSVLGLASACDSEGEDHAVPGPGPGEDAASPADPPPPTVSSAWRFEHPLPVGGALHAVWAGDGEAVAVGEQGAIVRLAPGGAVREAAGLTVLTLRAITRAGGVLWAVGDDGVVVRGEGRIWTSLRAGRAPLYAVWAQEDGVYFAGQGAAYRRAGRSLSSVTLPGWPAGAAVRGAATRGDEVFLVGAGGRVLHRQGGSWFLEADGLTSLDLSAVVIAEDGAVYAAGVGGRILRRDPDSRRWSVDHPRSGAGALTRAELRAVFAFGGAVYALGADGTALRRDGADWTVDATGLGRLHGGGAGAGGAYAVGDDGLLLLRGPAAGAPWQTPMIASRLSGAALQAVAADGALAYAVADDGTILRREGGTWRRDLGPGAQPLCGVAARGGEALAVGMGGVLLRRGPQGWQPEVYSWPDRRPDWRAVTILPSGDAYAVGGVSNDEADAEAAILHRSGGVWARERPAPRVRAALFAVAGDDQTVLAVGPGGVILRRTGPGWVREAEEAAPDVQLFALAQLGDAFHAAGSGGAVLRRDRQTGRWSRSALPTPVTLTALTAFGEDLWAVGTGGVAARIARGAITVEATLSAAHLSGVARSGDALLAVGSGGAILRRSGVQ